ncbi:hypothetical protein BT96DRAFT_1007454 [Gymnopus androsaceus JB14]|uniref:Uncharacterized protein n=1 Tax=Gymnopus androsaceus JB14 TaxID=1447944 RepID=A0A6A4GHH1_9AGAR|nr:hypothetical protein BT96DRAFT_1007454 [Gymnopus androsaceus JB14]
MKGLIGDDIDFPDLPFPVLRTWLEVLLELAVDVGESKYHETIDSPFFTVEVSSVAPDLIHEEPIGSENVTRDSVTYTEHELKNDLLLYGFGGSRKSLAFPIWTIILCTTFYINHSLRLFEYYSFTMTSNPDCSVHLAINPNLH